MTKLHIDYETRSEVDLTKVGLDLYSKHPSTDVLMMGFAFDDDEPELWLPHESDPPKEVLKALKSDVTKYAHNASFEFWMMTRVLGWETDINHWKDTMIMAHYCSFPGALEKVGEIIRLDDHLLKSKRGKELIKIFSGPQKPTKKQPLVWRTHETDPELFSEFGEYCKQDVVSERAIEKRLSRYEMPDQEWVNWRLDLNINENGYPIDREFIEKADLAAKYIKSRMVKDLNKITGLANSKAPAQMMGFAKSLGYPLSDLQKNSVKNYVKREDANPVLVDVFKDYGLCVSNSTSKYSAIRRVLGPDSRARNSMQFMGAQRTHREAGRTVQFQNIPRPFKEFEDLNHLRKLREDIKKYDPKMLFMLYDKPMEALISAIRSSIHASPGKKLSVADLAAIENVILGWLANCQVTLDEIRTGKDPYLAFGSYLVGRPYDELYKEYKEGDKRIRTLAKPGKLGAGYRLGAGSVRKDGTMTGLLGYADGMGIELSVDEAEHSIKTYRERYKAIVQFWYDLENACKRVISGRSKLERVGRLEIDLKGPFMRIMVPGGTHLHYCRPKLQEKKMPWGDLRKVITYEGLNDKKQWCRLDTHGGKLAENVTQKVARDILFNGIRLAYQEGIYVIGHVHDEVISECDEDDEHNLETLIRCITTPPKWGLDIPLSAAGYELEFYVKD